jgi:ribosomal protein L37AE/L43A
MRPDPAEEWQRLTKLYSEMSEGELLELAESYSDLTEIAQPILRDELKKRTLPDPTAQAAQAQRYSAFAGTDFRSREKEIGDLPDDSHDVPRAYLCECESDEQANQLGEALRREGIESVVQSPHAGDRGVNAFIRRIFVPGDQLAKAREIASRPIPQDIVDQSKVKVEDFVPPTCPRCGAPDPILESIDPVNTWRCDVCDAIWSDAAAPNAAPSESVS